MASSNQTLLWTAALAVLTSISACGAEDAVTDAGDDATVATSAADPATDQDSTVHEDDDHEEPGHDDEVAEDNDHEDNDHEDDGHDGDDHDDDAASGLGAHEHGVAELSLAWSDGDMVIDLVSPTYNIFGFEYEPTSDEDLAIVADRTEALSASDVLVINPEAACTADDVTTTTEFEGSHAELTASWLLTCENPDEIRQLDAAALFAAFPNLDDVDAQWASDAGQSSAELSPSATVLDIG